MIIKSYKNIKLELARNFKIKEFSVSMTGDYSIDDADWNYKDVPHLNIVHSQVDNVQPWMSEAAIATINFQKIFFVTLPMVVFNFDVERYDQVYFSSFGPILLLVNTNIVGDHDKCEVTTTYCLAAKRPFNWLFPLLETVILRNNKILMSEDTPMRNRRGELRRSGHKFHKPDGAYGFEFTTEIQRNNVIFEGTKKLKVPLSAFKNQESFIGEDIGLMRFK